MMLFYLFFLKLFHNSIVLGRITVFQYKLKMKNFLSFPLRKYVTNIVSLGGIHVNMLKLEITQSRLFGNS